MLRKAFFAALAFAALQACGDSALPMYGEDGGFMGVVDFEKCRIVYVSGEVKPIDNCLPLNGADAGVSHG